MTYCEAPLVEDSIPDWSPWKDIKLLEDGDQYRATLEHFSRLNIRYLQINTDWRCGDHYTLFKFKEKGDEPMTTEQPDVIRRVCSTLTDPPYWSLVIWTDKGQWHINAGVTQYFGADIE